MIDISGFLDRPAQTIELNDTRVQIDIHYDSPTVWAGSGCELWGGVIYPPTIWIEGVGHFNFYYHVFTSYETSSGLLGFGTGWPPARYGKALFADATTWDRISPVVLESNQGMTGDVGWERIQTWRTNLDDSASIRIDEAWSYRFECIPAPGTAAFLAIARLLCRRSR